MKKKKYHSNRKIVETCKMDTLNTHMYDCWLSWLGTVTSIQSGGIKLVLWTQTSFLSGIIRSCKCFPLASKMPTLTYDRVSWNVKILQLYTWYIQFSWISLNTAMETLWKYIYDMFVVSDKNVSRLVPLKESLRQHVCILFVLSRHQLLHVHLVISYYRIFTLVCSLLINIMDARNVTPLPPKQISRIIISCVYLRIKFISW